MNDREIEGLLTILTAAGALKRLPRAGWVRVGLPDPESVADHSFRLAILAVLFGPRLGLNTEKLLRIALLHDLAEAQVGDLTPVDQVTAEEKRTREMLAFAAIVAELPEGEGLLDLWREYEDGASAEARIAQQLDKLEMALQALEYEQRYGPTLQRLPSRFRQRLGRLPPSARWADEFWASTRAALREPLLIQFYEALWARRPSC